jgi:hypothetical protein
MWWFVAPGEIFFAWWLSMCVDDFMLFQMMVRPTYHTIHLSTSCIVMMHVGRDRVGFSFCCSFPQDRDGFREEVSFRGEVGRKSKSVVRSIVDSSVNYTFRIHSQGANNNKILSYPLHHIFHLHRPTRVPRRQEAHFSHWAHYKPSIVLTFARYQKLRFSKQHYISFGACRLVRTHVDPPASRTKKGLYFGLEMCMRRSPEL